ncbi:MAG: hypothetical protein ABSG55_08795 [Dehalococcoidia bacterium]
MPSERRDVLAQITFGQRVAEEEADTLASYFVETDQWRKIWSGDVDVVYGPKGSGKSAIYFLLSSRTDKLFDRSIILVPAENPRGAPAFSDIVEDPPTSEAEFRSLWRLYILALLCEQFQEYDLRSPAAKELVRALVDANLVQPKSSLQGKIRSALDYVRACFKFESIEGGVVLPGVPAGFTGRIRLREPSGEEAAKGIVSVHQLYKVADEALRDAGLTAWIVLDRLDVAFAERRELEENALRALFRVYTDLVGLGNLSLKIFLRDDIWNRITSGGGFREASHITRTETITWDEQSLMHLIISRTVQNLQVQQYYDVRADRVLASTSNQRGLFFRVFPKQVDPGSRRPDTFKWILSRTRDGTGGSTPRELIHLLEASRTEQLRHLELGGDEPSGEALIGALALKGGLPQVSKARLELTLYAEYPEHKAAIAKLEGGKTEYSAASLRAIWNCSEEEARREAQALAELGFFEIRGDRAQPSYWVPFLYRDALNLTQGTAEA